MAISELFSFSFLFSITIIIVAIGAMFAYVNYRMSEQDHKLSSMVNVVTLLAHDLQKVSYQNQNQNQLNKEVKLEYASQLIGGDNACELISVSDDEYEFEDDEDEDVEDGNEDGDGDEVEDEVEDEDEDEDEDKNENVAEKIRILNYSLANLDNEFDVLGIETTNINYEDTNNIVFNSLEDLEQIEQIEHIKDLDDLEKEQTNDEPKHIILSSTEETDDNFLKNINMSDLGDNSKLEYKKMSLNKLREVVVSKGVVSDASKLKKNEILKILDEE
jgi:hypothetical protein